MNASAILYAHENPSWASDKVKGVSELPSELFMLHPSLICVGAVVYCSGLRIGLQI